MFIVFDSDGDTDRPDQRVKHENNNREIMSILGIAASPFPAAPVWGHNHAIWQTNLTDLVKSDFAADYTRLTEAARQHYAQEGGLEKNDLFIAEWVSAAHSEGLSSVTLTRLSQTILTFARSV